MAQEDVCTNEEIGANLEIMFNNKKYSDTVFLVNKNKIFASSHLVCVSSKGLSNILDDHFENCGDREIRIGEVNWTDSFLAILKYIYRLDLKLSQMNKNVVCEVLTLADRYELKNLVEKLKTYLSKLECFHVDFLVGLLNTAKKFKMLDLYNKLTVFAYENADQLVKHVTVRNLQYDVLLDLVKENSFYADEVDILKGVLKWHAFNISKNTGDDNTDEDKEEKTDEDKEESLQTAAENNYTDIVSGLGNQWQSTIRTDELLQDFSINVLKSLLSHIRFTNISVVEVYKMLESPFYKDYKEFLRNFKYFSPCSEPRIKSSVNIERHAENIDVTFSVRLDSNISSEEHTVQNVKWKLGAYTTSTGDDTTEVTIFLKCIPNDEMLLDPNWKCEVECSIMVILTGNCTYSVPVLSLPEGIEQLCVTFSSNKKSPQLGRFRYNHRALFPNQQLSDNYKFKVNFKSIQIKCKSNK